ncbi:hypothetical protein DM01DRAFT_252206 [Hesseltinella vesiculosa]|uniref:Uncharacterized protein n=1 Tax=Hesseltinella vesiculosa TaxID=101127 RepID=A0A1X2G4U9_9FUNG|nr:hypothetical protein DM01DRAFT_252206 [Hesseltinella vesiculosa]
MATFSTEQCKVFEQFKTYEWEKDQVFQAGVSNILQSMAKSQPTATNLDKEFNRSHTNDQFLQLLRAKHFYFNRFKEPFSFDDYLAYELELEQAEQEKLFRRVEAYDYDKDEGYLQGLPNVIQGWVQQQLNDGSGKLWDKSRLELEYTKTKAFYFSACIEKVDIRAYMLWKHDKEKKDVSPCPFANLWQNKGKGRPLKATGGCTITMASPATRNLITASRLRQLGRSLSDALTNDDVTSIFLTATVADTAAAVMPNPDQPIVTKDTKIISQGLAYEATYHHESKNKSAAKALDHLGHERLVYIKQQHLTQPATPKVTLSFVNGQLPLHMAYLLLWPDYIRVATENTLLPCHASLSHAPAPPLLLYSLIASRMARHKPLPSGYFTYLALAPPEFGRLRAPELLRLGLVDVFVPETQLNDVIMHSKRMAFCPQPTTATAVQLVLAMYNAYPGPDRITTWQANIEQVFGDTCTADTTFAHLVNDLESLDSSWSRKILDHWATMPPVLLKAIYKATQDMSGKSPEEILTLEEQINKAWRSSADYDAYSSKTGQWQSSLKSDDDNELVAAYFATDILPPQDDVGFEYEVTEKDVFEQPMLACPVTGQMSAGATCPVTGQTSTSEAKCPVTGQSSTNDAKCPVTGQSSANGEARCPMSEPCLGEASP